jgi:hypothetical protein
VASRSVEELTIRSDRNGKKTENLSPYLAPSSSECVNYLTTEPSAMSVEPLGQLSGSPFLETEGCGR